jgi:hypothetical protein
MDRYGMPTIPSVKLTINFNDPDLEPEEREQQLQLLMTELKQMDEVEAVDRVLDSNPPAGNKALGGFLVGLLAAEVNVANAQKSDTPSEAGGLMSVTAPRAGVLAGSISSTR